MLKMRIVVLTAVVVAFIAFPAYAGTTLTAVGEGWCEQPVKGDPSCNNTNTSILDNTFAGNNPGGAVYRDWFAFNIPNLGESILSADLRIWNYSLDSTADPSRTYTLYNPSIIDFPGLASGPGLGGVLAGTADTGVSHYVDIVLNGTALGLLNSAQGNQFLFGGAADIIDPSQTVIFFGFTDGTPAAQLTLNGTSVPEPGTISLVLAGLAGLGLALRRKIA